MTDLSTNFNDTRIIKSWFGFIPGLICVGISILALFESVSLQGILELWVFYAFGIHGVSYPLRITRYQNFSVRKKKVKN